ncbi:MAG: hypothetical protein ACYCW6_17680, partial [Candidatus Xenobia bacterium]
MGETSQLQHELATCEAALQLQQQLLQQVESSQQELLRHRHETFDFFPLPLVVLDSKGVVLEVNLPAAGLLRQERTVMTGSAFVTHLTPASGKAFRRHLRAAQQAGLAECEIELVSQPGLWRMVSSFQSEPSRVLRSALFDLQEVLTLRERLRNLRTYARTVRNMSEHAVISVD